MGTTRVFAIANQKGGVGKTTSTVCLADSLRARGRSVLVVDLDQQANASRIYGAESDGVATTYDLLLGNVRDARDAVQRTAMGDILPGDRALVLAEVEMASLTCRETMLADSMEALVASGAYDDVLIDCSPTLGVVTTNALVAADTLIVPVLVDSLSLDGVGQIMGLVDAVRSNRRLNPSLEVGGLVVCQGEPRQNITQSFESHLPEISESLGVPVYGTRVRRCVKVREAQALRVSLREYAPACTTAEDYDALAGEVDPR